MDKKKHTSKIFSSIVHTLFLREVNARIGAKKLGYLWAIMDALIPIAIFSVLHSAFRGGRELDYDHAVFIAVGFIGFNFFKNIVKNSMEVFESNKSLYAYKQIRPLHTIVTLYMVEFLVMFVTAVFLILLGFLFQRDMQVENFSMVIAAFFGLSLFAISIGFFLAVAGTFLKGIKKVVNFMFLPLMLLSALFYTVESLPPLLREYILWNPIVHFMEMLHGYYFFALDTNFVSYSYIFYWTFIPLFFALSLYAAAEKKIIAA